MFSKPDVLELIENLLELGDLALEWSAPIQTPEELIADSQGKMRLAAICMHLLAMGEGLKRLAGYSNGKLSELHPEIEWKKAEGMRNFLAHNYFEANELIVFYTAKNSLPNVVESLKTIRSEVDAWD